MCWAFKNSTRGAATLNELVIGSPSTSLEVFIVWLVFKSEVNSWISNWYSTFIWNYITHTNSTSKQTHLYSCVNSSNLFDSATYTEVLQKSNVRSPSIKANFKWDYTHDFVCQRPIGFSAVLPTHPLSPNYFVGNSTSDMNSSKS